MFKDILGKASLQISEFWAAKEKKEKRNIVIIIGAVLVLVISLSLLLTNKSYEPLYSNLEAKDAGDIMKKLQEMNVDAKASNNSILVPENDIDRLRMQLASEGYPKNSFDLSIVEKGSGFGSTEKDKQFWRQYQLQLDIEDAIKTMNSIANAKVNLTIPEESYLVVTENDKMNATAAVLLELKQDATISSDNVRAIAELVQKSVPGLKLEDVSVIDSNMNVLSVESDDDFNNTENKMDYQVKVQDRLRKQVLSLLQPVFGIGNVTSEVSVELDFSEHSVESVKYEPVIGGKTGIAVSIDKIREETKSKGGDAGVPGTNSNGNAPSYPVNDTEDDIYFKNSEKINYEVNTIKDQLIEEKGRIKKMTVSVVLDSNKAGNQNYADGVKDLVSATVGVDPENVIVKTMPFNGVKDMNEAIQKQNELIKNQGKQTEYNYLIMTLYGIIGFILLVVIALLLKKLFRRKKKKEVHSTIEDDLAELELVAATREERAELGYESHESFARPRTASDDKREDIENLITKDPEMVIKLLRNWMIFD